MICVLAAWGWPNCFRGGQIRGWNFESFGGSLRPSGGEGRVDGCWMASCQRGLRRRCIFECTSSLQESMARGGVATVTMAMARGSVAAWRSPTISPQFSKPLPRGESIIPASTANIEKGTHEQL